MTSLRVTSGIATSPASSGFKRPIRTLPTVEEGRAIGGGGTAGDLRGPADLPHHQVRIRISPAQVALHIKTIVSQGGLEARDINRIKYYLQNVSFQDPSSLKEIGRVVQNSSDQNVQNLWFQFVYKQIDNIVEKYSEDLKSEDPERQIATLNKVEAYLKLIDENTLRRHANLDIIVGKIDRRVLVQNTEKDYVIVAFLVDGPGTIHNHKRGVVGSGLSLSEASDGVEYRFKQVNKGSEFGSAEYDAVRVVDTIPQKKHTTLREIGGDSDLVHQISKKEGGRSDVRIHFYSGAGVSETGNPNAYTGFKVAV